MDDVTIKEFSAVLAGPDAVVTDPDTLTAKGHDYWGFGGTPGLLLRPGTRGEVVAVLRIAAEHGIHVVTRGGGSNCAAAMMPSPD
ncbi:MAG TPA: FAD-binding protein, partial [Mycobacterium sp.]|nr:FAD-binding protein [Mycobacterium sp.]